jgi:hypothetical protein
MGQDSNTCGLPGCVQLVLLAVYVFSPFDVIPEGMFLKQILVPHTMLKIHVSANGVQGQDDPILTDLYGDKCNLKVLLFQGLE